MITGNEPAMPVPEGPNQMAGLTIRQHFAAMAMQGIMSSVGTIYGEGHNHSEYYAQQCVLIADALIAELNKTPPTI